MVARIEMDDPLDIFWPHNRLGILRSGNNEFFPRQSACGTTEQLVYFRLAVGRGGAHVTQRAFKFRFWRKLAVPARDERAVERNCQLHSKALVQFPRQNAA